tara:strand:- start:14 stop:871 length:858 start_codon:yes stop_codon:yes gene_type:complete
MSTMYEGSTTYPYIIFNNLPKESFYNKQFSDSDYKNILSRYWIWKNMKHYTWFFERGGGILFADLFEKGTSPYIVGIMLSDTELRIYRFLNEESFSVINDYLFRYLYNIDFSISQTLSEKLEGMENHEIVHTFSLDLQPVYVAYRNFIPRSSLSLKTRGIGEYSSGKINTPRGFHPVPPAMDWRLALSLDRENEYTGKNIFIEFFNEKLKKEGRTATKQEKKDMEKMAMKVQDQRKGYKIFRYWGKITFLPYIESNQTFATIENINLSITADVLSKLTGIKIAIK